MAIVFDKEYQEFRNLSKIHFNKKTKEYEQVLLFYFTGSLVKLSWTY